MRWTRKASPITSSGSRPSRNGTTCLPPPIHEEVANRYLRNRFRTYFQLDCVFFHPDQVAPPFSDRPQDIWFGITHEVNGRVACGLAGAVANPEWCVVLCEEFAAPKGKMVYGALLGPAIWFWIPCDSTAANMPGA